MHQKDEFLEKQMATRFEGLDKKFSERCTKLFDKQVYAEKEINGALTLLGKEMEKLRFELTDVIDNKFEHISRNLESDTRQLRSTYEELSNDL